MMRLLNQLLGVVQFSYEGVLRRHRQTELQTNKHSSWLFVSLIDFQTVNHSCTIHLVLQSRHPLFEVKLESLVGL